MFWRRKMLSKLVIKVWFNCRGYYTLGELNTCKWITYIEHWFLESCLQSMRWESGLSFAKLIFKHNKYKSCSGTYSLDRQWRPWFVVILLKWFVVILGSLQTILGGSLQTILEGSLQTKDVIDGAGCTYISQQEFW